jgi:hypothetical protein
MAGKEYEPEGEQDHISKLAFTAVAAPDPTVSPGSTVPYEVRDLDQYIAKGPPATKREVISYYAYVGLTLIRFAIFPMREEAHCPENCYDWVVPTSQQLQYFKGSSRPSSS